MHSTFGPQALKCCVRGAEGSRTRSVEAVVSTHTPSQHTSAPELALQGWLLSRFSTSDAVLFKLGQYAREGGLSNEAVGDRIYHHPKGTQCLVERGNLRS
jgi:hypothetical protein